MLPSDVMEFFRFSKDFRQVGFYETDEGRQFLKDIKAAVKLGRLVAVSGLVGSGKTKIVKCFQDMLTDEREVLVSRSLALDKSATTLNTLMLALFLDLSTEKDAKAPTQAEKRERKLRELIKKRQRPVVIFVDDAHELHVKTLVGLKRLIELVQDGGGILSIVLSGHPKLKNDLRRPTMEEIGARADVFTVDHLRSHLREYIEWVIQQSLSGKATVAEAITDEAIVLLTERLVTPLQIILYLELAFEKAHLVGQKPVSSDIVENVLAVNIDDAEARLTRHGYRPKVIAEMLNVRQAEIRSFLHGQLAPGRYQELKKEMLAVGIPV